MVEVKRDFKPEFLNRIDEMIVFHKLTHREIKNIIALMLEKVKKRLKAYELDIVIEDSVEELIQNKGTDVSYGARPLRRAIQNLVEDVIAEKILEGAIKKGDHIVLTVEEEKVVLKVPISS